MLLKLAVTADHNNCCEVAVVPDRYRWLCRTTSCCLVTRRHVGPCGTQCIYCLAEATGNSRNGSGLKIALILPCWAGTTCKQCWPSQKSWLQESGTSTKAKDVWCWLTRVPHHSRVAGLPPDPLYWIVDSWFTGVTDTGSNSFQSPFHSSWQIPSGGGASHSSGVRLLPLARAEYTLKCT